MPSPFNRLGRTVLVLAALIAALAVGWAAFVVLPASLADLIGVVLAIGFAVVAVRVAAKFAERAFPPYNVAEVAVDGPITRDGGGVFPRTPGGTPADDIVDQIEAADADDSATALLLKLNTPGGEVVPSDDIRRAAMAFDGPTIAYATDLCASGGMWIASGCDTLWAREHSLIGSIGVIMSQVNATGLAEKVGLTYEGFTAGEYKDAGVPLKELTDDEREYFQGLTDGFYEDFVDRVADGIGLEPDAVRDTEARVYLGDVAREVGLVDELGDRDTVEAHLEDQLDRSVSVREFEPDRGLAERLRFTAVELAYAVGAGAASVLGGDREPTLELR